MKISKQRESLIVTLLARAPPDVNISVPLCPRFLSVVIFMPLLSVCSLNVLIYPWTQQIAVVSSRVSHLSHPGSQSTPTHPYTQRKGWGGQSVKGSSLWQVLLALCISWLFCFVLTVTNTLPKSPMAYGYMARTDTKGSVLSQAPWFRFPYPGEEKWVPFLFGTHVSWDCLWDSMCWMEGLKSLGRDCKRDIGSRETISDP